MLNQVVFILTPFLSFILFYNFMKVHNMLVIMFDTQFQSLKVVQNFMGNVTQIHATMKEYDQKIILHVLLYVYFHQNFVNALIEHTTPLDEDEFFGAQFPMMI